MNSPLPWDDKGIVFKAITAERFSKYKKHEKVSISDEKGCKISTPVSSLSHSSIND